MTRTEPLDDGSADVSAIRAQFGLIERVTGIAPSTCPWRSFYDPLVHEVQRVSWAVPDGNVAGVLGPDPVYLVKEGLGVYRRAMAATRADEEKIEAERRKNEAAARKAARRG